MGKKRELSEYSRQELYDLVWSTPASKLAGEFGISDVAISKRCKKLNVPRPSPGYWAKVAAGQTPPKAPLPPTSEEVFAKAARNPMPKSLPLPSRTDPLHQQASELLAALTPRNVVHRKRSSGRSNASSPNAVGGNTRNRKPSVSSRRKSVSTPRRSPPPKRPAGPTWSKPRKIGGFVARCLSSLNSASGTGKASRNHSPPNNWNGWLGPNRQRGAPQRFRQNFPIPQRTAPSTQVQSRLGDRTQPRGSQMNNS